MFAFNQVCLDEQVSCAHFVMLRALGETNDTLLKGFAILAGLHSCVIFPFFGIRRYHKTELYDMALCQGVVLKKNSIIKPLYYYSLQLDLEWVKAQAATAFGKQRKLPVPTQEGVVRIRTLRK